MTGTDSEAPRARADAVASRRLGPSVPAMAAAGVALWTLGLTAVSRFAHPTPLYFVETDLVGEYLPAARELAAGVLNLSHYSFKGPGYPLLLAGLSMPLHGDVALAARLLSPIAAGLAAWCAFLLVRMAIGEAAAGMALLLMLVTPAFVRYSIDAGTDMPALALTLASTLLLLRSERFGSRWLAGLLAGYAVITRSNAAFLLPCAVAFLATRRGRLPALIAYAGGALLPLGAWALIAARAGGAPADRNYLNVAWELYGQGVAWDQFEATIGARFHSMFQVLAYDPWRAAAHVVRNLFVHRLLDARDLVTPWISLLAFPGLILLARSRAPRAWLGHAVACALVLATVFYNARFALYLLPFYAAASAASFLWLSERLQNAALGRSFRPATVRVGMGLIGVGLVLASCGSAAIETADHLADAPHETRIAGETLRRMGLSGQGILARKPHVAYYAGMKFVPLPLVRSLADLPGWAGRAGARYLYYSGLEQVMRPEYGVLADSGVALPGFDQILWARLAHQHFCAVYRLTDAPVDSAAFLAAYRAALGRYEARRPDSPNALLFVAVQDLELGAPGEALSRLDRLERMGARDAAVEKLRSSALLATGDLEGAAQACRLAMTLEHPSGWHWARLGTIRARQGRILEARDCFDHAAELEPASVGYLELLGQSEIALKNYSGAAAAFERCVRLSPQDPELRRFAMGAWRLAGNEGRVRELYAEGVKGGLSPATLLQGTARPSGDSSR